jgi:hypothetical protein
MASGEHRIDSSPAMRCLLVEQSGSWRSDAELCKWAERRARVKWMRVD